jgi:hypothetical protein
MPFPFLRPARGYLIPRWLFLRGLGLIFFSAFYSLAFQVHGLIGARGILPGAEYLDRAASILSPITRVWFVPSVFWFGASDRALTVVVAVGIVSALLLTANVWPRLTVALCTACFVSLIAVLQDFSSYQSDGMLLEAGFVSIFFAPRGIWPGLGASDPPSWASLFLLRWEWFRIYFESGVAKLASGDPHWRNLTAMDDYYQNGPLPAWPGWYVQQLPHWYHATTAALTLVIELVVVWALFLPRRFRLACAAIVTALQIGIIATANYAFLNYLVLLLGVLLLDDDVFARWRLPREVPTSGGAAGAPIPLATWLATAVLGWVFYSTIVVFLFPSAPFVSAPARALGPLRIANPYGLFAAMTEARYEIEFQGSSDSGKTWVAYPFRYKPQEVTERPGIYAPYQPRFDWNLWFASLAPWQASQWVVVTQQRLIEGSPSVLSLFRADPFRGKPPSQVRTVLWQYWFTDRATRRATGAWWRRKELAPFAGTLTRTVDGRYVLSASP